MIVKYIRTETFIINTDNLISCIDESEEDVDEILSDPKAICEILDSMPSYDAAEIADFNCDVFSEVQVV